MKPTAAVVLGILQRGGWWSDYALIEAAGQTQAGRRLRELRAQGYLIERQRIILSDGTASHAYQYRLLQASVPAPAPEQITLALPVLPHTPDAYGPP